MKRNEKKNNEENEDMIGDAVTTTRSAYLFLKMRIIFLSFFDYSPIICNHQDKRHRNVRKVQLDLHYFPLFFITFNHRMHMGVWMSVCVSICECL